MRALVLVGGQGTRLRPLTYEVPKPMLPVVEVPMIGRVIDWLASHGVQDVIFSLGYRPDAFVEAFPGDRYAGVALHYAIEPTPLDTAGAIRFAAEQVDAMSERLVVVNGDILTDLDLGELIQFHESSPAKATISLTPVEDPSVYGVVAMDAKGRVKAFVEKPAVKDAPSNLINAGTYVLEPEVLALIEPGRRVSIEREIFPDVVSRGELYALTSKAYWLDTGTPDRYLQAQHDILAKLRQHHRVPESTEIADCVYLAPGSRVLGEVKPSSFIAKDAVIEAGALVIDSVIGERAHIGRDVIVRSSVVFHDAQVKDGALISSSIIGPRARVGEGVTLEDFSIIGANAEVGDKTAHHGARIPQ